MQNVLERSISGQELAQVIQEALESTLRSVTKKARYYINQLANVATSGEPTEMMAEAAAGIAPMAATLIEIVVVSVWRW